MKKRISIILFLSILLTLFPAIPVSAETSGVFTYTVADGQATITDCDPLASGNIEIPAMIENYPVIGIGDYAFSECMHITSVIIPNGIKSIGKGAFKKCTFLTSVSIPTSVTTIGSGAFSSCSTLTSVNVAADNANYTSTKGILYNKNKTEILCYPAGTKDDYFTIMNGVSSIGENAFTGCTYLMGVYIPHSVTTINNGAFSGCPLFNSIIIPSSVTFIGEYVFGSAFSSVNVEDENANYKSINGVLINKTTNELLFYPPAKSDTNYTIPSGVISIGSLSFSNCNNLKAITISNGVKSIRNNAIGLCSALTTITMSSTVTTIGTWAFESCTHLNTITIPNGVTTIGYGAFRNCYSLRNLTIPPSVTTIDNSAFGGCNDLTLTVYPNSYAEKFALLNVPYISYITLNPNTIVSITNPPTNQNSEIITKANLKDITTINLQIQLLSTTWENASLFLSFYDSNNKLLSMIPYNQPLQSGAITIPISSVPSTAAKMKIFCWDSYLTMNNLIIPYEI